MSMTNGSFGHRDNEYSLQGLLIKEATKNTNSAAYDNWKCNQICL